MRGRGADGVSGLEILDRDGWRCQIERCCFRSRVIPRDAERWPHPDPRSANIDHIVPWWAGGADTAENKRAAHSRCNRRRGMALREQQLPLFGWREDPEPIMRICVRCGELFPIDGHKRRCEHCRQQSRPPGLFTRDCMWCGAEFSSKSSRACTCSDCHNCSGCGKRVPVTPTSLPPDRRLCHECRRERRAAQVVPSVAA